MTWADRIKKYYDSGLWSEKMVMSAVVKGKITKDDYEEITGNTVSSDM